MIDDFLNHNQRLVKLTVRAKFKFYEHLVYYS